VATRAGGPWEKAGEEANERRGRHHGDVRLTKDRRTVHQPKGRPQEEAKGAKLRTETKKTEG